MQQIWPADKTERISVKSLVPYANNARTHSDEQIAQIMSSIREWGFTTPILRDDSGMVIAGHGRLLAAMRLGLEDVPVMTAVGWSESQKKAYVIADNRLALSAGWDDDLLSVEIGDLDEAGFDLELLGFDDGELDDLLACEDNTDAGADTEPQDDRAEELREKWGVETGQLWRLPSAHGGEHRLICGDCTDADVVARVMGGEEVGYLMADPPYGISVVRSTGKMGGSGLAQNPVYSPVHGDDAHFDPFHLLEMKGFKLIWGANYFCDKMPPDGQWIVWDKGRPEGTNFSDAELAWTSGEGCAIRMFRCVWHGMAREGESGARVHPTQKPVKLILDLLDLSGGIVCDPFGGSGTTMVSCEQLGRYCRMIEIDPGYCAVILQRMVDAFNLVPELVPDSAGGEPELVASCHEMA